MTDYFDLQAALNTLFENVTIERGPVLDVNSLYPEPVTFRLTDDPQFSELAEGDKAFMRSLDASRHCMDQGSMDPYAVAELVAMGAEQREREAAADAENAAEKGEKKHKTPGLLGCYVNGELKFQSRDHEAIRAYAADKMRPWTVKTKHDGYQVRTNNVWVAPVGSFQK